MMLVMRINCLVWYRAAGLMDAHCAVLVCQMPACDVVAVYNLQVLSVQFSYRPYIQFFLNNKKRNFTFNSRAVCIKSFLSLLSPILASFPHTILWFSISSPM